MDAYEAFRHTVENYAVCAAEEIAAPRPPLPVFNQFRKCFRFLLWTTPKFLLFDLWYKLFVFVWVRFLLGSIALHDCGRWSCTLSGGSGAMCCSRYARVLSFSLSLSRSFSRSLSLALSLAPSSDSSPISGLVPAAVELFFLSFPICACSTLCWLFVLFFRCGYILLL